MKHYSTNYLDTFIEVASDCPTGAAVVPPDREPKSVARRQYEILIDNPYRYTSDDILYTVNGAAKGISREDFFSKGQPCFRASALTKRYGWGMHNNSEGKVALVARESEEYDRMVSDENLKHLQAMRNNRKRSDKR